MARRSPLFKIYPRDHLVRPGDWPDGRLKPGAPLEVHLAMGISVRLREAMAEHGPSAVKASAKTDVGIQTVCEVLNGARWVEMLTIAQPETGLETQLWGDEHISEAERLSRLLGL